MKKKQIALITYKKLHWIIFDSAFLVKKQAKN